MTNRCISNEHDLYIQFNYDIYLLFHRNRGRTRIASAGAQDADSGIAWWRFVTKVRIVVLLSPQYGLEFVDKDVVWGGGRSGEPRNA